jgi:hypothetical protein
VLGLLCLPVQRLELTQIVGALAPFGQAVRLAQIGGNLDGLARRIPQQIDVCGVVNVGLYYEGVTTGREAFCGTFFTSTCPAFTTS